MPVGRPSKWGPRPGRDLDRLPSVATSPDCGNSLVTVEGEVACVLLLFSDTGGGHRSAARALAGALRQLAPRIRVVAIDPLLEQGPDAVRRICSLYPLIIQRWPSAWGAVYHASNSPLVF